MPWTNCNPGAGGAFMHMAIDKNGVIYATGDVSGIWKSTDNGLNWTNIGGVKGIRDEHVSAIAIDPDDPLIIHICTEGGQNNKRGIQRSADGGDTWSAGIVNTNNNVYFNFITVAPSAHDIVYAIMQDAYGTITGSQLYKSIDRGLTYTPGFQFNTILSGPRVDKLIVDPTNSSILWAISEPEVTIDGTKNAAKALLISIDAGVTWTQIGPPNNSIPFTTVYDICVDPYNPLNVYVSTVEGVWKNLNRGQDSTWTKVFNNNLTVSNGIVALPAGIPPVPGSLIGTIVPENPGLLDQDITDASTDNTGPQSNVFDVQVQTPAAGAFTDFSWNPEILYKVRYKFKARVNDASIRKAGSCKFVIENETNQTAYLLSSDFSEVFQDFYVDAYLDPSGNPWTVGRLNALKNPRARVNFVNDTSPFGPVTGEVYIDEIKVEIYQAFPTIFVTSFDDKKSWYSEDNGVNWVPISTSAWEPGWKRLIKSGCYSRSIYGGSKSLSASPINTTVAPIIGWVTSEFVFASFDKGRTFKQLFTNEITPFFYKSRKIENVIPTAISIVGNYIYVGYDDIGVWRSEDNGNSWKSLNSPTYGWTNDVGGNSFTILADPTNPAYVWCCIQPEHGTATDIGTMLWSDNYGDQWHPCLVYNPNTGSNIPMTGPMILGLALDLTSTVGNRTLYVTKDGVLYRSQNNGVTFEIFQGLPALGFRSVAVSPDGTCVFAGGEMGLWRTRDAHGAHTFERIGSTPFPDTPFPSHVSGGVTIIDINPYDFKWTGIHCLMIDNGILYICYYNQGSSGKGLYQSANALTEPVAASVTFSIMHNRGGTLTDGFVRQVAADASHNLYLTSSSATGAGGNLGSGSTGLSKHNSGDAENVWTNQMTGLPWVDFAWPVAVGSGYIMIGVPGLGFQKLT